MKKLLFCSLLVACPLINCMEPDAPDETPVAQNMGDDGLRNRHQSSGSDDSVVKDNEDVKKDIIRGSWWARFKEELRNNMPSFRSPQFKGETCGEICCKHGLGNCCECGVQCLVRGGMPLIGLIYTCLCSNNGVVCPDACLETTPCWDDDKQTCCDCGKDERIMLRMAAEIVGVPVAMAMIGSDQQPS